MYGRKGDMSNRDSSPMSFSPTEIEISITVISTIQNSGEGGVIVISSIFFDLKMS